MKKQTGVWIDSKKAVIIFQEENGTQRSKIVNSAIAGRVRIPGERKWFTRMGSQFMNFEKKKEAQRLKHASAYYKEIMNEIAQADEIVLFGPAATKKELGKYLLENKMPISVIKGVITADSMTDNQISAWVKNYFRH